MKRLSLFLVAILALGVVFGATSAVAKTKKKKVNTEVSIKFNNGPYTPYTPYNPYSESFFHGKAKPTGKKAPKRKKCKKGRVVKIKHVGGGTMDKRTTDAKGRYEIPTNQNFTPGDYFAKVKKKKYTVKKKKKSGKKVKIKVTCKAATSNTITVP